jgi:hypothetical protein
MTRAGIALIVIGLVLVAGPTSLIWWAHHMFTIGLTASGRTVIEVLAGLGLLALVVGALTLATGVWLITKPKRLS